MAAVQTGRSFIGIEQLEAYFTTATDRIQAAHNLQQRTNEMTGATSLEWPFCALFDSNYHGYRNSTITVRAKLQPYNVR